MKDTGAAINIGGPSILERQGLTAAQLIPTKLKVTSADSSSMDIQGAILVEMRHVVTRAVSPELVYICSTARTNLLSYDTCEALGIVSSDMAANI